MIYSEADYLIAKLRGEIESQEVIKYIKKVLMGDTETTAIPVSIIQMPPESCEQWLARMNRNLES